MIDETIESWLAKQIESATNEVGMLRSYRQDTTEARARLTALVEVRDKIEELWGERGSH